MNKIVDECDNCGLIGTLVCVGEMSASMHAPAEPIWFCKECTKSVGHGDEEYINLSKGQI